MDKEVRDDYKKRFGERLREARKRKGIRHQKELADLIGVTLASINYYESGERIPDAYTLRKLSETLGCSADYLLLLDSEATREATDITEAIGISAAAVDRLTAFRRSEDEHERFVYEDAGKLLSSLITWKDFEVLVASFSNWSDTEIAMQELNAEIDASAKGSAAYKELREKMNGDGGLFIQNNGARYLLNREVECFLDDYADALEVGEHGNETKK